MATVETVCGPISAADLGVTSTHEHIIHNFTRCIERFRETIMPPDLPQEKLEPIPRNFGFLKDCNDLFSIECYVAEDLDVAAFEVERFKELGGESIVDVGGLDIRGNIETMRALSQRTGVNIICSTGLYQYVAWPDALREADADTLCSTFLGEIENGIDGTNIKPGAIKAAVGGSASTDSHTYEREMTNVRAGAMASRESDLPLIVHTSGGSPTTREEALKVVDVAVGECGMNPDKLLMCHLDTWAIDYLFTNDYVTQDEIVKTVDVSLARELLDRGVNVGFDTWGNPAVPPALIFPDDNDRLKALYKLLSLDDAYASHIVLGDDFLKPRFQGVAVGGYGMTRAVGFAAPMLVELGMGEAVEKMLKDNPARIFSK